MDGYDPLSSFFGKPVKDRSMSDGTSFVETTIHGERTHLWRVAARECAALAAARISHLGLDDAASPYERVRLRPSGSFFLACLSGEGQLWMEGRWQRVTADMVCMAPPRVLNAFHAISSDRWQVAWLRYEEPPGIRPMIGSASPVLSREGGLQLGGAVQQLRCEWEHQGDPQVIKACLHLIELLTTRLSQPWRGNERLRALWEEVERAPGADWSLESLAKRVHVSDEYLRRLCVKELGRTPVQHLTYIRMRHAQHLLETTDDKIEVVAAESGYECATVFSRAFKRCIGMAPSEYRMRKGVTAGD